MTYTPTVEELEEMGFTNSGNIRKPHEWFIVTDSSRIRYFTNSGILETTELGLMPSIRAYIPQSKQDIKTLIRLFTQP